MPANRFQFSLSWYSEGPTFGEAIEHICKKMQEEFLSELRRAGVAFTGNTAYGPHTTILFEADSVGKGFHYADLIQASLRVQFQAMTGISVRCGGQTAEQIVDTLEAIINNCAADLKKTRNFFRNPLIADVRATLEAATAHAGKAKRE